MSSCLQYSIGRIGIGIGMKQYFTLYIYVCVCVCRVFFFYNVCSVRGIYFLQCACLDVNTLSRSVEKSIYFWAEKVLLERKKKKRATVE